jgi:hypothetical protein
VSVPESSSRQGCRCSHRSRPNRRRTRAGRPAFTAWLYSGELGPLGVSMTSPMGASYGTRGPCPGHAHHGTLHTRPHRDRSLSQSSPGGRRDRIGEPSATPRRGGVSRRRCGQQPPTTWNRERWRLLEGVPPGTRTSTVPGCSLVAQHRGCDNRGSRPLGPRSGRLRRTGPMPHAFVTLRASRPHPEATSFARRGRIRCDTASDIR